MVRCHFIKVEYRIENQEPIIFLIGRTQDTLEKKIFRIAGFQPYFYVAGDESIPSSSQIVSVEQGLSSIFGEKTKKIITHLPSDVRDLRKYFNRTFEADVPFVRRFLIDQNIKTFFEIPNNKDELHYTEIKGE